MADEQQIDGSVTYQIESIRQTDRQMGGQMNLRKVGNVKHLNWQSTKNPSEHETKAESEAKS